MFTANMTGNVVLTGNARGYFLDNACALRLYA